MKPPLYLVVAVLTLLITDTSHGQMVEKWVQRYNGPANSNDRASATALDSAGNVAVTGYSSNGSNNDYYTAKYAAADGALLWENRYTGPANSSDAAYSIAVDSAGNVVVTGDSDNASTSTDYYTAKYAAANGALLWERRYNGPVSWYDSPQSVAVDSAGNVAVTGYSSNGSNNDYYTAKYAASDGALLWEKRYNGPANSDDIAYSVAVDAAGNVAVTGKSVSSGGYDYYTAKYASADGVLLWEKRYNGPANWDDLAFSVAVDSAGNVAVTGLSSGSGSNYDYYTAKYAAADGALLWEKRYNGPANSNDTARSVAVDSAGNVAVTGESYNVSNPDYYTAKYAAGDGALLWEKRYNGAANNSDTAEGVAVDNAGNVVVTGYSSNGSNRDYYTAKYAAADGALLWEQRYNGPANRDDAPELAAGGKLALTPDGGAVVTGQSQNGSNYDYATVRYGTAATAPSVASSPTTGITTASATISGTVNPNGTTTSAQFEYGTTISYGSTASVTISPSNGTSAQNVSANLSSLTSGTLYHYRLTATNAAGTSSTSDGTFTTLSSNANLSALTFSSGSLSPPFAPGTISYTAAVSFSTTSITITPTRQQANATITVNGSATASGMASAPVNLTVGDNAIPVIVTAQDGTTTQTYTVTVTRAATAGPGDRDFSFGSQGIVTTPIGSGDDSAEGVVVQPDGKIIAVGYTIDGSNNDDFAVVRYNADGSPDASFGTGGKVITPFGSEDDDAFAVALQSDGKIVVAGRSASGTHRFAVARYNTDGSPDGSFGTGGKVVTPVVAGDYAYSVAVQTDGKIVVAGRTVSAGTEDIALVRYTSAGVPDSSFGTGGKVITPIGTGDESAQEVKLQSDGKIVVAGFSHNGSNWDFALVRYNSNGSRDSTFGTDGKVITAIGGTSNDYAYSIAIQPDGKFIVAGSTEVGGAHDSVLVRYTTSGIPDTTFNGTGKLVIPLNVGNDELYGVTLQSDGKILAAGYAGSYPNSDFALLRYNADGTPDNSFYGTGKVITPVGSGNDIGKALAVQPNGRVVVAGIANNGSNSDFALVRYLGDLRPVVGLAAATGVTATTATLNATVNPNESVTAAQFDFGLTTAYGSSASVTLTPNDGSSPQTVSANLTGLTRGTLYHYRLTATNSAGTSNTSDGTFFTTGPGSLDVAFDSDGIATTPIGTSNDYGQAVAVQADGKVVVAGFIDSATINDFAVARFNADGTPDTSFGTGGKVTTDFAGHSDYGRAVAIQPDGKIVVAGQSYNAAGTQRFLAVARYTIAGALDSTFGSLGKMTTPVGAGGNDDGRAVVIQPDGKIVVAGIAYSGTTHDFALVRFTTHGFLDTMFNGIGKVTTAVGSGDDLGLGVALQSDGKIIVSGSSVGATYDMAVVRYTSTGFLDTTFNTTGKAVTPVSSGNDEAYGVVVQGDGKIVVGGYAGSYPNSDFALVRYNSDGSLDTATFGSGTGKVTTNIGGNDGAYGLTMQRDGKLVLAGFSHNGSNNDFAVARYNADGSADSTFYGTGKTTTVLGSSDDPGMDVALQSDGSILVAGFGWNGSNYDFALARYLGGPYLPSPTTLAATDVLPFTATLNGTANPNDLDTTAWFEYGTTTSYGTSTTAQNIGSGWSAVAVTANPTGLTGNTLYHARLVVQNGDGTVNGNDISFITPAAVPEIRIFAGADDTAPELTDGQTPAVDFGSTLLGTPVTRSFTVKNVGTGNLHFAGITLPVIYAMVASPPYDIAPNASVTFQVRFLANTVHGTFGGAITLSNDDGDEGTFDFPVTAVAAGTVTSGGTLDTTFGAGGKLTTSIGSGNDLGYSVALQGDGKIVVGGASNNNGSPYDFALVRYNANGTLDTGFGSGGKVTTDIGGSADWGYSVAVQGDGKMVLAGVSLNGSNYDFALVRYNANGALDTSFGSGGKATTDFGGSQEFGYGVAVQGDGKILVAGYSDKSSGNNDFALVRYNANGTLDAGFGSGGKVTTDFGSDDRCRSLAVQIDGKIVVAGHAYNGTRWVFALIRYANDGMLDNTFGSGGKVTTGIGSSNDEGHGVTIQADGKIVVAGAAMNGNNWGFALMLYSANGTLDTSFGSGGKVTTDFGSATDGGMSVAVQTDGRILVGGYSDKDSGNYDFALVRYNADGTLDTGFGSSGKVTTAIGSSVDLGYSVAVQGDGRIIVAGQSNNGSNDDFALVRYEGGTTSYAAPTTTTLSASGVVATDATINGTANPNGIITSAWFEYGTTTSYGQTTASQPQGYGTSANPVNAALTGLTPGTLYHYRLVAQNGETTAYGADLTFTTLTLQQGWRQQYFGTSSNAGNAADSFDFDKDGLTNLLEWACNLNPTTASVLPVTTIRNGAFFEFTYTRSVAALNAGAAFIVEWSDDLPGTTWTNSGVTEQLLSDNSTVQQVKALVPVGSQGRRFAHLKVTGPP